MVGFKANAKVLKQETKVPVAAMKNGASPEVSCLLAAGTEIEGNFSARENVRLDGRITGEVKCSRRFAIGEKGRVEGSIEAAELVVWGIVEGNVKVHGTLHIKSTGRVLGDIKASQLVVEEGGKYEGECFVGMGSASDD